MRNESRRWLAAWLVAGLLCFAGVALARPGGGNTYRSSSSSSSSHSSSSSYTPSHSSSSSSWDHSTTTTYVSGSSHVSGWTILVIVVGAVVLLALFVGIIYAMDSREVEEAEEAGTLQAARPRPTPANIDLRALQQLDADFSLPMFEDFAYRLYARAYRALHDETSWNALCPYFSAAMQQRLLGAIPQTERVAAVAVGAIKATSSAIGASHTDLVVYYEANLTLAHGSARFVRESWIFRRPNGLRTRPPAEVERLGCPSCGAAFEANSRGQCIHCHAVVADGRFGWQVVERELFASETVPPSLLEDVEEAGTDLPTRVDARSDAELRALFNADPQLDQTSLRGRLELIYRALNKSWNTRDLSAIRPYVTDSMYDYLRYWIEAYSAQGVRNEITDAQISRVERVKVQRDRLCDAITFRFWATGYDATVSLHSDLVVCGSRDDKREYSEYWTLLRSAAARGKPRTDLHCPSCAATLVVEQAGCCSYCGTHVTRGEFDWVLSKIEQDDAYA